MNCSECEQLFDAYLDGQLSGSLRLEFDAHRLRCRRCQQTLAMLEAVGHVIASDWQMPELSEDFADRVMRGIEQPRPRVLHFPLARVAVLAAAAAQAAAVLIFAVLWNTPAPPAPVDSGAVVSTGGQPDDDPGFLAIRNLIVDGVEDRIWAMHNAGRRLTADVVNLAGYLDILIPADLARESSKMANVSPLRGMLESVLPPQEQEPESAAPADGVHSI
jgi:hypothetical protein